MPEGTRTRPQVGRVTGPRPLGPQAARGNMLRAGGVLGMGRNISSEHPADASVSSPHGSRCGPVPTAAPHRPHSHHTTLLPS